MNFGSFLAVLFFVCLFMSVVGLIFPSTAFFLKNKTRGKAFFSWIGISILVFLLYALIVPSHKNNTENQNQISQTESQPIGATSDNTNSVEDRMKEAIDVAEVSSNPDLGSGKGKIYLVHMKPDNFLGRLSHVGYKISSSLEKWMNQNLITSDDTVVFFMPCELVDNYGKHSVDTVMKITYNGGEFSFQVQDARRSCGVLQRSIPVPFSTRGPSSAGCLSGTLPSSISHADRQSKSWFASGNSPSKDHLYSRLIPSARGCGDRQNRTEYAVHFQFSDTRQTPSHDLR